MCYKPPLPAPFPAVVKLLPESQPEPKPSSIAQEHFSCWWDWIQNSPCCSPFFFFPSSYAWERLALPLSNAVYSGESRECQAGARRGLDKFCQVRPGRGDTEAGQSIEVPWTLLSKPLGEERTGGEQARGTQGQLQPEPPAVGPHRGSWGSRCLLDPTELPSLLNL